MADNIYRIEKNQKGSGKSIFSRIEGAFKVFGFSGTELPLRFLPQILFVFFLLLVYIGNSHYADKTIRNINRLESEVEDLRADYTTMKAEYMLSGKQSEVAKKVKLYGLKESLQPPQKIILKKGEY